MAASATRQRITVTADTRRASGQMSRFRRGQQRGNQSLIRSFSAVQGQILGLAGSAGTLINAFRDQEQVTRTFVTGLGVVGAARREWEDLTDQVVRSSAVSNQVAARIITSLGTLYSEATREAVGSASEVVAQYEKQFEGAGVLAARIFRGADVPLEEYRELFDLLSSVSTGIGGAQEPLAFLQNFQAPLEELGLTFAEQIILTDNLLAANIRLTRFAPGLARVASEAADANQDANEFLFEQIRYLQTLEGSQQRLAIEQLVGVEAAGQWSQALQNNAFDIRDVDAALAETEGTLQAFTDETASLTTAIGNYFSGFNRGLGGLLEGVTGGRNLNEVAFELGSGELQSSLLRSIPGVQQYYNWVNNGIVANDDIPAAFDQVNDDSEQRRGVGYGRGINSASPFGGFRR